MVYPACAGIDLLDFVATVAGGGLPRMRGDRPCFRSCSQSSMSFTPHARGSTVIFPHFYDSDNVYPACAGIDLILVWSSLPFVGLPRMRGDRPESAPFCLSVNLFTPHARGSTPEVPIVTRLSRVYPACAGIDPSPLPNTVRCGSLPRMRGDRPDSEQDSRRYLMFTPHARGSTWLLVGRCNLPPVYPACAGIDR